MELEREREPSNEWLKIGAEPEDHMEPSESRVGEYQKGETALRENEEIEDEEDDDNGKSPSVWHAGNRPDKYVTCPYFPEHQLRHNRLPYHLLKCQHAPNAPKLVACPFNYLHRVKPEDRFEHAMLCEDKPMVRYSDKERPSFAGTRNQILVQGGQPRDSRSSEPIEEKELPPGEEEWW